MWRWIFPVVLLLASTPELLADKHHRHGHRGRHARMYHRGYVVNRPPVMHYNRWAPRYGVMPMHYRTRFRPVPARYRGAFGPVPYGCRRAYVDGYVVDYRPSNFFVVQFGAAW